MGLGLSLTLSVLKLQNCRGTDQRLNASYKDSYNIYTKSNYDF